MMKYVYLLLLILIPMRSYADNNALVTVGYAYGGATIAEKEESNSLIRFSASSKIRAGSGQQGEIGYEMQFTESIGMRYLLGYKYNSVQVSGTRHEMLTYPASMLLYYKFNRVSFGGGLTYHINPTYKASATLANSNFQDDLVDFENALGVSASVNIALTPSQKFSLEIRYTNISYQGGQAPRNTQGLSLERKLTAYDADNIAILGVFRF